MRTHTPGPWVFRGALYRLVQTKTGPSTAKVNRIALSTPQNDPAERTEAGQNARLIAAAPELLEALRGVVRVADRDTPEFGAARAAIAKAEGGGR